MPPFKTLLAASLLLISCLPGAANAGLYSSDKNNFGILKTNLTDASKYRYAALVSTSSEGDNFETLHQLSRIYAEILEKDMGVPVALYNADTLHLKNIDTYRAAAIEQIRRKNFTATADTCALASTFLYPSTVSNLLRIMAPDIVIPRNDPAIHAQLVDVSKHFLAQDLGVLMKMCEASPSRKQTAAFKEFLEALQKEQPYIASTARLSQHRIQANAEQNAEDARRAEIDRKAFARKAEQDKAYQAVEDARDAKILADQAAVREEQRLKAQRAEQTRQQALAARTPEQVNRDNQQNEDVHFCYKYAAMNKVATDANNQGMSIERAEQVLVDMRGLKGQDAEDMRSTIRVVRLTHANDTPNQAFTLEYDRCLALRAKKRAEGSLN
ncbi:hypothetical protein PS664_03417 [Pseudomonas fluorescens]|nr:hypothetical protein PS664_03417 [Pseudomonas fluorescens]